MATDNAGFRAMMRRGFWSLLLLLAGRAMGQTVSPTNETASLQGDVGFLLTTTLNNMNTTMNITPLTGPAGLSGPTSQLQQITPTGPLFLTNGNTVGDLKPGDIAYISCEDGDYTGTIGSGRTVSLAANIQPDAIVFYSTFAARCNFNPGDGFLYSSLYTMVDANSSSAVVNGLSSANPADPIARIHLNLTSTNATNGDSGGTSNILGRSPTTAVAMIILYSITGIITALFLIIIVVGAVRAHRHPERYGPRRIAGRPRQSRAKGIARAMLETIPIVKFGDSDEENKAATQRRDIEMTGVDANNERNERDPEAADQQDHAAGGSNAEIKPTADNERPKDKENDVVADSKDTMETGTPAVDSGLACSVCVEDFEKGQDIRVLPCKHKFHPECIDPWLLNVSGTCPLCRVDLRPAVSQVSQAEPEELNPSPELLNAFGLTPDAQAEEESRPHRRSRIVSILNIGRMREATPEERLNALRRLREEGMINPETTGERSRRRFSHRWSRAFGSRPTSTVIPSRPVSEVPGVVAEPPATSEQEAATHEQEHASHDQESSRNGPPDMAPAAHSEPVVADGIRPATPSSSAPVPAETNKPPDAHPKSGKDSGD